MTAFQVVELAAGSLLVLGGVASLVRWWRREFLASSAVERLLFVLHVTARVGLWFGFGAILIGYALVDEPQRMTWFLLLPMSLAAVQLLTSLALGRSPAGPQPPP